MSPEQVAQTLKLVDDAIGRIAGQQLVSSAEMTDLLLDIRLYLMTNAEVSTTV